MHIGPLAKQFATSIFVVTLWTTVHASSATLYQVMCTPKSMAQFAMSAFTVNSPYCCALRWVMSTGAESIASSWALISSLVIGNVVMFRVQHPENQ